ncbi:hypothetical protein XEULMG905_22350 [Xanthomonas euvesicatoria]|nr:hypothetical protein XEULMG905_22350 [Xanthomonas euvesicatoria]
MHPDGYAGSRLPRPRSAAAVPERDSARELPTSPRRRPPGPDTRRRSEPVRTLAVADGFSGA